MIPIKDDNPTKNKSYVRLIILIICSLVFLLQISSDNRELYNYYFGFKPASFFSDLNSPTFFPALTIITSIFMHGGWMHFLGNMLYLWIFADNVEDVMGKEKFIIFYIISGIVASFAQAIVNINSVIPMIGASGSIAGILGAYLYLFPKVKVLILVPFFIFFTIRIPAFYLLIFWFIYQFVGLNAQSSNIAWFAHIGGFLFGFLYSFFFVQKQTNRTIKKGRSIFLKKGPWD